MRLFPLLFVALSVAGCNWIYDLRSTELIDAGIYDAPIDAPFQCPPIGVQPAFSPLVQQVVPRNCQFYSTSPDLKIAAGMCDDGTGDSRIETGPLDGELGVATLSGAPASYFSLARLTPEGDELWVRRATSPGAFISVYTRVDDRTWTYARDLVGVPTPMTDDRFSAPTRKVGGTRRFVQWSFSNFQLLEYADDGTTTTLVHTYGTNALDTLFVQFPNLSADGLRLLFAGQPAAGPAVAASMYADRATTSDLFGAAAPLRAAPVVYDPYLTEDCGRLYTSGLGSVFYAPQQ